MRAHKRDEGFYIAINSPAYDDYGSLEVVMHAKSDGYWHRSDLKNNRLMKLGNNCYISTIPRKLYPFETAQGIQEIKAGQDVTDKSDEIDIYKVVKDEGPLTDDLHPEISDQCPESNRKKFTLDYNNFEPNENDIDSTQSKQLRDGKIIPLNPGSSEHFVQT